MSWKAVVWAKSWRGELTSPEAFVLFVIAEHFNEREMRAWPSVATLQSLTRHSRSTVHRSLDGLERKGLIAREYTRLSNGRTTSTRYCLPFYSARSVPQDGVRTIVQGFGNSGEWEIEDAELESGDLAGSTMF